MYKRFYFTCFAEHCLHYEEIREVIVQTESCFSGGTVYHMPELWCDDGIEAMVPHKCIGPTASSEELELWIKRRRYRNAIYY